VRTERDQCRGRDALQPRPDVMSTAGDQLHPLAPSLLVGLGFGAARRDEVGDGSVGGMLGQPTSSKRTSRRRSIVWVCSAGGVDASSSSGYDDPPSPPGDVQHSIRRSMRSGQVTASSCATIPPKLMLNTLAVSQPTWSSKRTASCAKSAMVGWRSGTVVRPNPRWSWTTTSNWRAKRSIKGPDDSILDPDPLRNNKRAPSRRRSQLQVDITEGQCRHPLEFPMSWPEQAVGVAHDAGQTRPIGGSRRGIVPGDNPSGQDPLDRNQSSCQLGRGRTRCRPGHRDAIGLLDPGHARGWRAVEARRAVGHKTGRFPRARGSGAAPRRARGVSSCGISGTEGGS
jgi:hypothetical protein